jgi:hypothetical protein
VVLLTCLGVDTEVRRLDIILTYIFLDVTCHEGEVLLGRRGHPPGNLLIAAIGKAQTPTRLFHSPDHSVLLRPLWSCTAGLKDRMVYFSCCRASNPHCAPSCAPRRASPIAKHYYCRALRCMVSTLFSIYTLRSFFAPPLTCHLIV